MCDGENRGPFGILVALVTFGALGAIVYLVFAILGI